MGVHVDQIHGADGDESRRDLLRSCARLADFLPRSARERIFEPHFQDILGRFIEDSAASGSPGVSRRLRRRFLRAVRLAVALSWWSHSIGMVTSAARWIAVALLGDGAVRLVYWLFSETLRRL